MDLRLQRKPLSKNPTVLPKVSEFATQNAENFWSDYSCVLLNAYTICIQRSMMQLKNNRLMSKTSIRRFGKKSPLHTLEKEIEAQEQEVL